jgi:hypothetical protein
LHAFDIKPVLVGELVEENILIANNSSKNVNILFKTFNRNIEMTDIKIDNERNIFIAKSSPSDFAKEIRSCISEISHQNIAIPPLSEFNISLFVKKVPTEE